MADWYVDESNTVSGDGSFGNPWQTLPLAQAGSSPLDRIFIRGGIYTHSANLDRTAWMSRRWLAYKGEDVLIDCNGGGTCFDGILDISGMDGVNTYFMHGLKFTGYTGILFAFDNGGPSNPPVPWVLWNCFFEPQTNVGTKAFDFQTGLFPGNVRPSLIRCTFVNHAAAIKDAGDYQDFKMNIFDGNTFHVESQFGSSETINSLSGSVQGTKDWNAYPGNTEDTNGINTSSTAIGFNNAGGGDYSLAPASALRGAGEERENIGASFNPMIRADDNLFDLTNDISDSGVGENDEDYYETGVGPGPDGPGDAGPATWDGTKWKIDNVTVPGAMSARVHIGPITLPAGSKVTVGGLAAIINEVPASGSKEIIGVTVTDRDWHVSLNGGSKQVIDWNTFIDQNATTIDLYMTLRADGETEV